MLEESANKQINLHTQDHKKMHTLKIKSHTYILICTKTIRLRIPHIFLALPWGCQAKIGSDTILEK